jgi:hypothetical protein
MSAKNTSLEKIATQIKVLEKKSIANIVEIGRLLTQVRDQLEHGQFGSWLQDNFSWSLRTSARYREVYELSKSIDLSTLNISLSAVHELVGYGKGEEVFQRIVQQATEGRVSYKDARRIQDEYDTEEEAKREADEDDNTPQEEDDESDYTDTGDEPPPADDTPGEGVYSQAARALGTISGALRLPKFDAHVLIDGIGAEEVRDIIRMLQIALNEYTGSDTIKAKADAAEARAKQLRQLTPAEVERAKQAVKDFEAERKAERRAKWAADKGQA